MIIRQLNHIQITIPIGQEAAGRQFYCHLLKLTEIEKPLALQANGGFWLQIGIQQIHIGVEDGINRLATKAHLAYEVDDLAAWRSHLHSAGVTIVDNTPIPGYSRLMLRDPFGNRIELIQPLAAENEEIGDWRLVNLQSPLSSPLPTSHAAVPPHAPAESAAHTFPIPAASPGQ